MLTQRSSEEEAARIEALRRYDVLDTEAEQEFDDFTALASQICAAPVSAISLVDTERLWFKSRVGLDGQQIPRRSTFCDHAIRGRELLEVPDALEDPRFADTLLVTGPLHVRFYGGAPLTTPDGHNIGTLCVLDRMPRGLTPEQRDGLMRLARQLVGRLELRRAMAGATRAAVEIRDLYDRAPCGYHSLDENGMFTAVNETELRWRGYRCEELIGRLKFTDLLTATGQPAFAQSFQRLKAQGHIEDLELELVRKDGTLLPVRLSATAILDADGRFLQSRSTMVDDTARRLARDDRDRLFDVSLDMLCTADFGGHFLSVNPAFTRVLGWTRAELLSRPFLELVHPEDRAVTVAEMDGLARGAPMLNFEKRFLCKDGSWRWLTWRAVPDLVRGEIVATGRDEHDLRTVRQSLIRSEEQHRVTLRAIGDGVVATDSDGRITLLNGVAEKLTGWTEQEARGRSAADVVRIIHAQSREVVHSPVAEALSSGEICTLADDTLLVSRAGTETAIADSAAPIRDRSDAVVGAVMVFRDTSAERAAQKALAESEANNRSIVESNPDCLKLLSLDGHLTYLAPTACRIMEVDDFRALDNVDWLTFWHGDDREAARRAVAVARSGGRGTFQGFCPTFKGSPRWWDVAITPILGADGKPLRLLAVSRDITENKVAEVERAAQAEQQRAMLEVSTDLLAATPSGIDAAVERALKTLGTQLRADHADIFLRSGAVMNATHEWCGEGVSPRKARNQDLPVEAFAWSMTGLPTGAPLHFRDVDALPDDAASEKRELQRLGVRALLVVPLMSREGLVGRLSVTTSHDVTEWSPSDLAFARLGADAIIGSMERARSDRSLSELNQTLEQRVRARSAALQEAERAGGVGSFEFDLSSRASVWSDALHRIYGRDPATFTPSYEAFIGHVHPEDRAEVARKSEETIRQGGAKPRMQQVYRIIRADGEIRMIESSAEVILAEDGRPRRIVGVCIDVTDRLRAERTLRDALTEKETLLKEIHHRVKNNLQIISSLLSMQVDATNEASTQSVLQESIHRVRSMALIHERLYQSATLARIDFGEYARSLTAFLFRSYEVSAAVELKVDVEAAELNIETAVPLGLLLNELVSNALKHAFGDGRVGALRVSLHPATGGFRLTVADTGPGMPRDFELARAKSMGMTLVHSLARQLKADVVVTSDGGACFRVDFKELTYATR